jgi:hypothetical protein
MDRYLEVAAVFGLINTNRQQTWRRETMYNPNERTARMRIDGVTGKNIVQFSRWIWLSLDSLPTHSSLSTRKMRVPATIKISPCNIDGFTNPLLVIMAGLSIPTTPLGQSSQLRPWELVQSADKPGLSPPVHAVSGPEIRAASEKVHRCPRSYHAPR